MRNRTELEAILIIAIEQMADNGDFQLLKNKAKDELENYFDDTKVFSIFSTLTPIVTLSENELYHIAKFFLDNRRIDIDISEYFNEAEITDAMNDYKKDNKKVYNGEVTFENVLFVGNNISNQYITTLSYQEIAKMYEENVLKYNFETQRIADVVKARNITGRTAHINMDNVEEIKKSMLVGKFESNTITLNVRRTGVEVAEYSPEKKNLWVDLTTSFIDVIDGYHRVLAIYKAWLINPNISGHMIISIKNLTVKSCRYFIAQESKGTINNQAEMFMYDADSNIAILINDINTNANPNNILKNRITTGNKDENTLIYYDLFASNMNRAWAEEVNEADSEKLERIEKFLIKFYDITYKNIMKKMKIDNFEDLKGTIALDQMFIAGVLYAAQAMYEKNNGSTDSDMIKKMVSKLDLEDNTNKNKYTYENDKNRRELNNYIQAWSRLI